MAKKNNKIALNNTFTEFLLYTTPNGKVNVEIYLKDENIWLTQEKIAQLFGVDRSVVTKHLKNIFAEEELQETSVCAKIAHTANDGKNYLTKFYNLDAIISVGYRVSSREATLFRIWATERLKEFIIKGFTMDDERLKNPNTIFGKDYFDEQLARIRDIRSSERRFYQKITDIYADCSADYDSNNNITKTFFATVQNKLHWAISKQTASELILNRADSKKENMGLTTWKNAPKGKIRKTDVIIAKNYLEENELKELNLIVTMYLDYAELQAQNKKIMYMKDWIVKLDAFLKFNDKEILDNPGAVRTEIAKEFAESEYLKYNLIQEQIYESDFDKVLKISNENE
jgi:hypothetical protein